MFPDGLLLITGVSFIVSGARCLVEWPDLVLGDIDLDLTCSFGLFIRPDGGPGSGNCFFSQMFNSGGGAGVKSVFFCSTGRLVVFLFRFCRYLIRTGQLESVAV